MIFDVATQIFMLLILSLNYIYLIYHISMLITLLDVIIVNYILLLMIYILYLWLFLYLKLICYRIQIIVLLFIHFFWKKIFLLFSMTLAGFLILVLWDFFAFLTRYLRWLIVLGLLFMWLLLLCNNSMA